MPRTFLLRTAYKNSEMLKVVELRASFFTLRNVRGSGHGVGNGSLRVTERLKLRRDGGRLWEDRSLPRQYIL